MATTEILLVKPIEGLGYEGDHVKVAAGYARNFLLPKKMAVPATRANKKQIESLQKARQERLEKELDHAREFASRLERANIAIAVKTGPGGKLFGSVTAQDLQARLKEEGIELKRKQIPIHTPIKTLGKHTTRVKLHAEVTVEIEFEIVSENPIESNEES